MSMSNPKVIPPTVADAIDGEMQALMDQYLLNRRPVSLDDYDWGDIRPDTVERDLIEALYFVSLVECNPWGPAEELLAAADRGHAPWLRRFIELNWLPEERMHHVPCREYLIRSGEYDAADIDSAISEVRSRGFVTGTGYTPLEAVTYGWLQELITWRFYEAMASYLLAESKNGAPVDHVLLNILRNIAKQENFHRFMYLSGVEVSLKHAPHTKRQVIGVVADFLMPGHHMVPHLQPRAPAWAIKFGLPLVGMLRDICRDLVRLVGYNGLGQAIIFYGRGHKLPWNLRAVSSVLAPLARPYHSPLNYLAGRLVARI